MRNILKILLTYLLVFTVFTGLYLVLFHTSLFSSQRVLFYRGIFLMIFDFILTSILIFLIRNLIKTSFETLFAAILISISINLSVFVVLPVTFERSITMFLLNTLKSNNNGSCHGLTKSELQERLINDYIIKKKAIDKRVYEQAIIDFIKETNQCIQLTPKAINFLKLSEVIGILYGLR